MTVTQTTTPSGNSIAIKTTMNAAEDRVGFYLNPPQASTDSSQLIVQANCDDGKIIIEYSVVDNPKEEDFVNLRDPNGRINQRSYSCSEVVPFKHYRALRARLDTGGTGGTIYFASDMGIRSVHSDSPTVTLDVPSTIQVLASGSESIKIFSSINNKLIMWSAESSDSTSVSVGEFSFDNDYDRMSLSINRTADTDPQTITITATPIYGTNPVTATITVTA